MGYQMTAVFPPGCSDQGLYRETNDAREGSRSVQNIPET